VKPQALPVLGRKLPNLVRREFHLFTLFSAMRPDALTRARWEHLNVGKRVLCVPDPKGGKQRAFDLPLSQAVLRCLWRTRTAGRHLHGHEAHEWIFPSAAPCGHIGESGGFRLPLWKNSNVLAAEEGNPWLMLM
jgi:integrase